MIYCNECFNCPLREKHIEPHLEKAIEYYQKVGKPFAFKCGAEYASFRKVEPPFSAPSFSSEIEIAPSVNLCLKFQYLSRRDRYYQEKSCASSETFGQDKKIIIERIKRNRGPLTYEEVVLKWVSCFTGHCEWLLHMYYEDSYFFIWDDFFNERDQIQKFLLDMVAEDIKDMRGIIAAVYGDASYELFLYDLLLATYRNHLDEEYDNKKEVKEE